MSPSSSQRAGPSKRKSSNAGEEEAPATKRQAEGKIIYIFVRLATGRSLGIEVNKDDQVKSIFTRIASKTGIRKDGHVLVYEGKQLDVEKKIEECGIERDSTVHEVGRLRSSGDMEMWRALDRMVSISIQMCRDGYDVKVDREIRKEMGNFLTKIKNGSDTVGIRCLSLFRSMSAEDALGMLYLSNVKNIEELGAYVIELFFDAVKDFDARLQSYAAISVLQFCNRLRMKGLNDAFYCDCRRTLSSIVLAIFNDESNYGDEISITWQDIVPYEIEMGEKVANELNASLESPLPVTPKLEDVQEFHSFLSVVVNCITNKVILEEPIRMPDGVLEHPSREQFQSLHSMFFRLLKKMDECLCRTNLDLSRSEGGDGTLDDVADAYLLLLKSLNDISRLYYGAEENLWEMVARRNITMHALLTRTILSADDVLYIDWLLEHKQFLDIKCRKHLAMTLFPQISVDPDHEILIDRSQLFAESFTRITLANPEDLQSGFYLKFRNEEATGPGVLREWLILVCKEIFTTPNALFLTSANDHRRFHINPASKVLPHHLDYFKFCGRLIALALMYEVQIGIVLDNVLFVQLAGLKVKLEDIKDTDPTMYQSCKEILNMDADVVDSDALGLTFAIEYEEFGRKKVVELCPGGGSVKVNSQNRHKYVKKLIRHRFQTSTSSQLEHFSEGFEDIMSDPTYLQQFFRCITVEDLDSMLSGSDDDISVEEWKAHTEYDNYTDSDPQIIWFWKVVEEMSPQDRRQLLFFWTAIKYLPIDGFSGINSRLEIRKVEGSTDQLPVSHTCFNLILLPEYPTLEITRQRIAVIVQDYVASSFGVS